jgi:hypothetical protein
VHKNKILTNKEKIGNNIRKCTYVPSLPRSQQKAIRCELLKRHQLTSSNASIKSHSGRHAASSGSFPWSSRPSDNLGLNVDSSGFPHSLSPQSTYWCENASSALHCPTYNGEPAVCVLESKRCSLSLLIVLPDITTPRTYEYQLIAQQEYFTVILEPVIPNRLWSGPSGESSFFMEPRELVLHSISQYIKVSNISRTSAVVA